MKTAVRVAIATFLALACSGCAVLNESSAARRAGTYPPGTSASVTWPSGGRMNFESTGNDKVTMKGLKTRAGDAVDEFTMDFNRSDVVLAQGERAKMITELLGQDIEMNRIWGETWIQTLAQVNQLAAQIMPALVQMKAIAGATADLSSCTADLTTTVNKMKSDLLALKELTDSLKQPTSQPAD